MPVIIFIGFVVLLIIGMPLPGAMGLASVYGFSIANLNMQLIFSGITRTLNSYTLLAIPFFVLAGNIMSKGSIAKKLLNVAEAFGGKRKLTMGLTTIVACAFFAALSGSSVATVAAIGAITFPMMVKMGYEPAWSAAITASGAIVGPIIPPSVIM